MFSIKVSVLQDAQHLSLGADNGPKLTLSTQEVQSLIRLLILYREHMAPALPSHELQPGDRVLESDDTLWTFGPHELPGRSRLALHHPGVGWVAIALADDECQELFESIKVQLATLSCYKKHTVQ